MNRSARRHRDHYTQRTRFAVGDQVRARDPVQGLSVGAVYRVTEVHEHPTPFGVLVSYRVAAPGAEPLWIGNGHLVLEEVPDVGS